MKSRRVDSERQHQMRGHDTVYRAPDSYNPGGHSLYYAIGNEVEKLDSNRQVVHDNRWAYLDVFHVLRMSFEIPPEWVEEAVNVNSTLMTSKQGNFSCQKDSLL